MKILQALASVLLATAILVGGTWAYLSFKNIPCDLTIIEGITDIEIYSNEACTIPVTAIHFGDVRRGSTLIFEMWVKNIGVEPVSLSVSLSETWVTILPSVGIPLDGGDVQPYTLELVISPVEELGERAFNIEFYEE